MGDDGRRGFGVVIRDKDGNVLAAAIWNGCISDSSLAEAMAVLSRLQLAANILFLNIQKTSIQSVPSMVSYIQNTNNYIVPQPRSRPKTSQKMNLLCAFTSNKK